MLRIVRDMRQEAGPRLVIHACGGISSADEAWQALQAGADTPQLFTALVYQGPGLARAIAQGLAAKMQTPGANVESGK